ncbi:MAG: hypothetical protein AWM53_01524 [Candidatus Dichloromethanomonas elyunquensis]|nr:MAG: hypothetical protein AWM53_01524 [Candidatus Dichloromethanomonas elyunquensis]
MTKFEQITQSIDSLAEFLASEAKGENRGCAGCNNLESCTGKETCKKTWIDCLTSKA